MKVTPTGQRLTIDGNVAVKYGRDVSSKRRYAVWFRNPTAKFNGHTWAMEADVREKLADVDGLLIVSNNTLYVADIDALEDELTNVNGDEQHLVWKHDTRKLGAPADHLRDTLYYE